MSSTTAARELDNEETRKDQLTVLKNDYSKLERQIALCQKERERLVYEYSKLGFSLREMASVTGAKVSTLAYRLKKHRQQEDPQARPRAKPGRPSRSRTEPTKPPADPRPVRRPSYKRAK